MHYFNSSLVVFFFLPSHFVINKPKAEQATSTRSTRHGVFTDQFIFRTVFGANFEYLLNSTNQSAKPTDVKMIYIFCLLITFSFPF